MRGSRFKLAGDGARDLSSALVSGSSWQGSRKDGMSVHAEVFIHETADVSDQAVIGRGTRIWHQAQVMPGARLGEHCNIGKGVFIASGATIGSNVKVQNYVSVYKGVTVEDDVCSDRT